MFGLKEELPTKVLWKVKRNILQIHTYKFSGHDNNNFILFLRQDVYLYEFMDDWEKLNENFLLEK